MGQEILRQVNDMSDEELAVNLLYRDKHGTVRSMYNGRKFGWIDVEHRLVSLCMDAMVMKKHREKPTPIFVASCPFYFFIFI